MLIIKYVGNGENLKHSRSEVIKKYKSIKEKWDNSNCKYLFEEDYKRICNTLERLENGESFRFVSGQEEQKSLIIDCAIGIASQDIIHSADRFINKKSKNK